MKSRLQKLWDEVLPDSGLCPQPDVKQVQRRVDAALDNKSRILPRRMLALSIVTVAATLLLVGTALAGVELIPPEFNVLNPNFPWGGDYDSVIDLMTITPVSVDDENYTLTATSSLADGYTVYFNLVIEPKNGMARERLYDAETYDLLSYRIPDSYSDGIGVEYDAKTGAMLIDVSAFWKPAKSISVRLNLMDQGIWLDIPVKTVRSLTSHDFITLIFYVFRRAIPFALIGLAAGAALLILLNRKHRREGVRFPKGQAVAVLLLPCYLGGLAAIKFMNSMDSTKMVVQLRPFLAFFEAWNSFTLQVWLNPLLNVAMFLPLGALLPLAAKPFQRWYWMLAAGMGTSLVIEMFQHILGRGQADVDDLICNTLGTMLGYCLCMLSVSLAGRRWKIAGAYAAFPVLSAAVLGGVFLAYHFQPYGNLADAPIYAANTKGVEWVQNCSLSDEPGPSGVYWAEPFTVESCDAFAVEFIGRQGGEIRFGTPDVDYYDNIAAYSDHITYSFSVNYKDRSYEYIDFRVDSDLRFSGKGGTTTEDELRTALEKLGIAIPDAARFIAVDEEKGEYAFRAECVIEDGVLTDGELSCWVVEGGILYRVKNTLSVSTLQGDAAVISPQEAYERLCAGRFSWRDVPMFDYLSPYQVRVNACELGYLTDSKGFRQPVYTFTLSDDNDAGLRSRNGWTTFVPALAGSWR